ncbi:unnamed protein product [Caenorhabditis angaria]|uniref:Uncharacterized protein n=1 Tax=Caenorhabditis angaria TaxID=860376 RepID=A0A9P1N9C5_9PELO|nr:unnamed protein product [Caenorhabditis angaria]
MKVFLTALVLGFAFGGFAQKFTYTQGVKLFPSNGTGVIQEEVTYSPKEHFFKILGKTSPSGGKLTKNEHKKAMLTEDDRLCIDFVAWYQELPRDVVGTIPTSEKVINAGILNKPYKLPTIFESLEKIRNIKPRYYKWSLIELLDDGLVKNHYFECLTDLKYILFIKNERLQ